MRYPARVKRVSLLLALGLWLAATAAGAAANGKPRPPSVYVPNVKAGELPADVSLDGPTWTWTAPGYRVQLRQLDEEERRKYVLNTTGSNADPFAGRPDRPRGFLTFLLLIDNLSDEGLFFQPQNCWLRTPHDKIEYPLDQVAIRSAFTLFEQEFPPAYEKAAAALLEGEKRLTVGQRVHGLLVYHSPHERMKRFTVDIPLTLSNGEQKSFSAPYRVLKKDEQSP